MKLNPSIKNMSNEYIFFTDQTALTFRICLVTSTKMTRKNTTNKLTVHTRTYINKNPNGLDTDVNGMGY